MTDFDPGGDSDGDGIPNAIDGFDDGPATSSVLEVSGTVGAPEPAGTVAPQSPVPALPPAPQPPPDPSDEAAMRTYQEDMERYSQQMQLLSNIIQMQHDTQKAIVDNLRS